jgi:hypothetical protein
MDEQRILAGLIFTSILATRGLIRVDAREERWHLGAGDERELLSDAVQV